MIGGGGGGNDELHPPDCCWISLVERDFAIIGAVVFFSLSFPRHHHRLLLLLLTSLSQCARKRERKKKGIKREGGEEKEENSWLNLVPLLPPLWPVVRLLAAYNLQPDCLQVQF